MLIYLSSRHAIAYKERMWYYPMHSSPLSRRRGDSMFFITQPSTIGQLPYAFDKAKGQLFIRTSGLHNASTRKVYEAAQQCQAVRKVSKSKGQLLVTLKTGSSIGATNVMGQISQLASTRPRHRACTKNQKRDKRLNGYRNRTRTMSR